MKSNICINVEFLAGTSLEDAFIEANIKAIEWGVAYVTFSFNGIRVSVSQKASVVSLVEQWQDVVKNNRKCIVG